MINFNNNADVNDECDTCLDMVCGNGGGLGGGIVVEGVGLEGKGWVWVWDVRMMMIWLVAQKISIIFIITISSTSILIPLLHTISNSPNTPPPASIPLPTPPHYLNSSLTIEIIILQ